MILCFFTCESDVDTFFNFFNTQNSKSNLHLKNKLIHNFYFDTFQSQMMDISFAFRFLQKTAIGLFTNYLGFTTLSYKAELVRTLVHYAFMISSSLFFMKRLLKLSISQKKLLSYIGHYSSDVKCKINIFCKLYCKNF